MTLALLITAVTGAWAAETLVTIDAADYDMISTATSFSKEKDGITIAFSSAKKLASYFELQSSTTVTITSTVGKIKSVVFSCPAMGTAKYGPGCLGSPTAGQYSYIDMTGTWTGEAESFTLTSSDKVRFDLIYVTVGEPDATEAPIKVTTNAASAQDLFTEATFNMPAFDATVNYLLVRDMSIQMTAQVGDGTDGVRYRVKKAQQGEGYEPADMEMAAVPALFTVNDAIEQKTLTQTQDYIVQIYAIDAEGQPTGDPMTFATFTFEPGIYAVKAVAAQGSNYAGETALSNTFKLFQGYEVTVPAGEYITYYKDEPLYVEDEDALLYTITSVSADQAVLSEKSDAMPSNTPMLVYNKSNETKTILLIPCAEPDMTITVAPEFVGTLEATTIAASTDDQTNYALNGKQFVWVKDAITVGANKAWISIPKNTGNLQFIKIRRSIEGGEGTTGIDASLVNSEEVNSVWYDLNGRRLQGKPAQKGIYIKNGKKVVVK